MGRDTDFGIARMEGFWILLLEMATALAIAAFIVWWTTRK